MKLRVSFYVNTSGRSPIEDFIEALPNPEKARIVDVLKGLEEYGFDCPRVQFRLLDKKLWEIKYSIRSGSFRIAYVVVHGNEMIWLHIFKKKTQKTELNDLKLAKKRLKEVLNYEKKSTL